MIATETKEQQVARAVFDEMETPFQDDALLSCADHDIGLIAQAILAERERCAKIAEDPDHCPSDTCCQRCHDKSGEAIAAAIRKGEPNAE